MIQSRLRIQKRIRARCSNRRFPTWWILLVILVGWAPSLGPSSSSLSPCGDLLAGSASPASFACAVATEEDGQDTTRGSLKSKGQNKTLNEILINAGKRGLGGGIPGALAGVVQVLTLMWLRTIINYQCRYGTSFLQAFKTLFHEGGVSRFYKGLPFALVQAPLARFASTASNDGVEALLANLEYTRTWGPGRTTVVASFVVGLWRIFLMPIDTCKTVLQIDSAEGFRGLMRRVKAGRIHVLYEGAVANAISSIMGHYPWFFTYNILAESKLVQKSIPSTLLRNAGIGLVASIVSDCVVNAVRVVKTTKQAMASKHTMSYGDIIRMVLATDGWTGMFRGLRTRIFANALQSMLFTVLWRSFAESWQPQDHDQLLTREEEVKRGDL